MEYNIKQENEFSYIEVGEGPVLVLLHGLMGALSNFKDVVDHFKSSFTVTMPLLPLFDVPVAEAGVKPLYEYVNRFIEYKGYDKVSLLGNSLGGHVALVYAVNHPDKMNHLILTGSSGLYENAFGGSYPKREDKEFIRHKVVVTFYDPKLATDDLVDEVYEMLNDRMKLISIIAIAKNAIRYNMSDELHKITAPTCLIWGKNDTITPPEVGEDFNKLIKNSELFWIDQCGHAPMMEHPVEFNKILEDWLKRHPIA